MKVQMIPFISPKNEDAGSPKLLVPISASSMLQSLHTTMRKYPACCPLQFVFNIKNDDIFPIIYNSMRLLRALASVFLQVLFYSLPSLPHGLIHVFCVDLLL